MADATVPVAPVSQAVQAAVTKELGQILSAIGTVQSLPANLPTPDRPVVLTGTVLPPPPVAAGQPNAQVAVAIVQTALGALTLNVATALPPGPITVQIQPGSPPTVSTVTTPSANQAAVVAAPPATLPETAPAIQPALQATPAVATPAPPATVGQILVGTFTPTPTPVQAAATLPPAIAAPIAQAEPSVVPTSALAAPAVATAQSTASPAPAAASPLAASSPLLAQESASSAQTETLPSQPAVVRQVYLVLDIVPAEESVPGTPVSPPAGPAPGGLPAPSPDLPVTPGPIASSAPPANAPQPVQAAQASATPASSTVPAQPQTLAVPAGATSPPAPVQSPAGQVATPTISAPVAGLPAAPASVVPSRQGQAAALPAPATPPQPTTLAVSGPSAGPEQAPVSPATPNQAPPSSPVAPASTAVPNVPVQALNSQPAAPSPAAPVTATVLASTNNQQPILAVSSGTILIGQPVAIKTGTTLSLQVLTPAQATTLQPSGPSVPAPLNRDSWPALQQGLTALATANPAALAALARFIPTLGEDFAGVFAAYLTRQGNGAKAGDDDAKTILAGLKVDDSSSPDLRAALGMLQGDVLAKPPSLSQAGQTWQNFPVPVLTEAGLSLIQVYVHQYRGGEKGDAAATDARSGTARFLLEVHPSLLGPVQLDGLLNQSNKGAEGASHLDLIVRSEAAIPADGARELQGLFIDALEATGLTGRLSFQYGRENFIQPESGVGGQIEVKA